MKALVYDFDGVLVDSNAIKDDSFVDVFREQAPEHFEALLKDHETARHTPETRFERMERLVRDIVGLSGEELRKTADLWVNEYTIKTHNAVVACDYIDGAMSLIDAYQGKVPQYVASATPEKQLQDIVHERGIYEKFEAVWGGPRPKTDMFREVCERHGITDPTDLVFFGDSNSDWVAANEFGCTFIAIDQGKQFKDYAGPIFKNLRAAHEYLDLNLA